MNELIKMDEIIHLTSSMFLFEELPIFDINTFNYFNYLHVGFKRKRYFYNKRMRTFLSKCGKKNNGGLDSQNWVFNDPFY